ncbi:Golgin subfamily A member 7/ERF4 [Ophiocordyceps camponoti-floridani]|uniref:Ras modification protein ERF4 n=1 Tax=Ophiocordyceps camponoti-floridani TaxID=2030778 RepID=A0A8H4Q4M6_9HYPO|nr:Golgin subfamily A member 7/ERF4 [Ophiocordyceps camponoti-floridani]
MGDDVLPDNGVEEWGPQHPCYPHLNPHVPPDSPEYTSTRIIRIRRDWLPHGDLAPTLSNLYPEILDPAGLSEHEFRRVIDKLNLELVHVFNPFAFRNVVDGFLGVVTGWLWDDCGFTAVKKRLHRLERWIDAWNRDMEKTVAADEGVTPPKMIPLRQTAYMTLDIQIADPEIAPAPSSIAAGESRSPLS